MNNNENKKFEDWDNLFDEKKETVVENKPEQPQQSQQPQQTYHSSQYTNRPTQSSSQSQGAIWGIVGVVAFVVFILFMIIPSKPSGGGGGSGSSSNYSLTNSSLKEGYGGSYNYTGRLTNTTDVTHEYRVSVYIYDSGGRVLASKSEHYILAGGGSGTISIFLFPGNTLSTYEVMVTGIRKT